MRPRTLSVVVLVESAIDGAARTWGQFIGQAKAVREIRALLARPGFDGGAFLLAGSAGCGKTSLGWLIARELACDFHIQEIDGDQCSVERVRDIVREMTLTTFDGRFRVYLVNECQNCTPRAVQALLTTLEHRPPKVLFIFTTTTESDSLFGEYCGPFHRRCKCRDFTNQGQAELQAKRLVQIANAEGLNGHNGDSLAVAMKIVRAARNNFRESIQQVDKGAMLV